VSDKDLVKKLEDEVFLTENLPHLFAFKFYKWSYDFFHSQNKICLLTAGNQLSKSSTQIRKMIEWSVNKSLWPKLWKTTPRNFIYMYPSAPVATVEIETKWIPEFLPRGPLKDSAEYGWHLVRNATKQIIAIKFNSGITIHFKSYEQNVSNLQTITAHYIAADEELPVEVYDEVVFRISGTDGFFSAVFTATKGQEFWRECMEEVGTTKEKLPDAWKRQVSAYDCLEYMDGTKSHWTIPRIKALEARCKSPQEVLKRVHGRFVRDDGLRYLFRRDKHQVSAPSGCFGIPTPGTYAFAGVDYGSGNTGRSKSAIVFGELSANSRKVRIFKAWRGDGVITTAGDLFNQYMLLKGNIQMTAAAYDYGARDFYVIAERNGEPFFKADKARTRGDELINTLLRYDLLTIDSGDEELDKLCLELLTLAVDDITGDDLVDALRYCIMQMPIDWNAITAEFGKEEAEVKEMTELDLRRSGQVTDIIGEDRQSIDSEIASWNEEYN